ncbi:MAG: CPBP family intramembrane metalloprotease [Clostridiales bacterium]|nr:CPBP family intramembrane metalloprotease [Clostridiales bacterium]
MNYRSKILFHFFLGPFLCIVAYLFIMMLAAEAVYSFEGEAYLEHEGLIYLVEGIVGIGLFTVWYLIRRRMILYNPTWSVGKPIDWVYTVFISLSMLGFATLYFLLVTNLPFSFVTKALNDYADMTSVRSATRSDLYMNVFSICILIPILEEMIFRGCVLEGMLQLKKPVYAILISAFYFGVMHGQIIQIVYAFVCGAVLGLLYYVTHNICTTILAHIIFNIMGSGIYMLFSISDAADRVLDIVKISTIAVSVLLSIYMLRQRNKRFPEKEESGDINKMLPGRHT